MRHHYIDILSMLALMLEPDDLDKAHAPFFKPEAGNPIYAIEYFFENIFRPRWAASCLAN